MTLNNNRRDYPTRRFLIMESAKYLLPEMNSGLSWGMLVSKPFCVAALLVLIAMLVMNCGSPNRATFTSRPDRTGPLDTLGAGRYKTILPSRAMTAEFAVPDGDSCKVLIELHQASTQLVRILADSVYAPGKHTLNWLAVDQNNMGLNFGIYYYLFDICGKISTRRITYRPTRY